MNENDLFVLTQLFRLLSVGILGDMTGDLWKVEVLRENLDFILKCTHDDTCIHTQQFGLELLRGDTSMAISVLNAALHDVHVRWSERTAV